MSRRTVIKAAAIGAGAAIGSGAVQGFPTIWAQNLKDIKLLHVGQSYSAIKEIGTQASKDLGFTVEIQVVDANTQLNRLFTQPKTIDINDMESFDMIRLQGKKVLAPIPTSNTSSTTRSSRSSPRASIPTGARSPPRASRRFRCSIGPTRTAPSSPSRPPNG